jgi:hypothetical protein
MIILALTGLTVIGRLSPILVVFATLAELTWLLYMATPFVADHLAEEINVFGEGLIQASERLIDTSIVTEGMYWVVLIGRVTTLSIALLAVAGAIRRCLNGFFDVRAATLLAAPIPLPADLPAGQPFELTAVGDLTIHGVTERVELPLRAQWDGTVIDVAGGVTIVMADYGMEPPSNSIVSVAGGHRGTSAPEAETRQSPV